MQEWYAQVPIPDRNIVKVSMVSSCILDTVELTQPVADNVSHEAHMQV